MEKEKNIQIPEGYEIDYVKSTYECIKFRKKKEIRTWEDYREQMPYVDVRIDASKFHFDDKFIKHLEAELKIKLLMPYYGGEITKEEWGNGGINKYAIFEGNSGRRIFTNISWTNHSFLAFHTEQQRDDFLKYNVQLVKDYFMLND